MKKGLKPQLVVVPDENFAYGIEHGAYPQLDSDVNSGKAVIVSPDNASKKYGIAIPTENTIYVINPYSGIYINLADKSIERNFVSAKSLQIREVLVMLGAKSAELTEEISRKKAEEKKGEVSFQKSNVGIGVNASKNEDLSQEITSKITLNHHDRQAKPASEIRAFMDSHGLGDDPNLKAWLERYIRDGKMSGSESLEIEYLEELNSAREIAGNLKILTIESKLKAANSSKETHSFKKTLLVDFGE